MAKLFVACVMAGVLVAGVMLPYLMGAGLGANKVTDAVESIDSSILDMTKVPERTTITDSEGNDLAYVYDQNRTYAPLAEISVSLQQAVISVEDRRFKQHHGVDWQGTLRAVMDNTAGEAISGGSSITQQLVKNYRYLVAAKTPAEKADAIARTPIRKLSEAKIAIMYDNTHTKNQILEQYLNLVAFGPNTYGAEAAAEHFFAVGADRLTLSQAALLAAMINNPNSYNPLVGSQTDVTLKRRNLVLNDMERDGWISAKARDEAKSRSIAEDLNASYLPNGCIAAPGHATNGFFCRYVLDYLQNADMDYDDIARGGYTITTTLDPEAMKHAQKAVRKTVSPDETDAARIANVMAVVEPGVGTRKVLALAANRPYGLDQSKGETVQRLTTTFAPLGAGGTFELFTAATALEKGLGVDSTIDVPAKYTSDLSPTYTFHNKGKVPKEMSLNDALIKQPNTAFVALEDQAGLKDVVSMAVDLGLRGYQLDAGEVASAFAGIGTTYQQQVAAQKVASFTLGVSPVSPLELANVGATVGSDGMWCPPTPIASITDRDGNQVSWNQQSCEQAVPAELAHTLTNALSKSMTSKAGTAYAAAKDAGWDRPAASLTGTTLQYRSGSFLAYTPYYSGAVMTWDYLNRPEPICINPLRSCSRADAMGMDAAEADADSDADADAEQEDADTDADEDADEDSDEDGAFIDTGDGDGMTGSSIPEQTWLAAMLPLHQGQPETPFPVSDPRYLQGIPEAKIPDVEGMSVTDAKALLEANGFTDVTQSFDYDSALPANTVVSQDPKNSTLSKSTVTLTVSAGGSSTGSSEVIPDDDGGWSGGDGPGDGDSDDGG